jgi:hypothetical protein
VKPLRFGAAAALAIGLVVAAVLLHERRGREASFSILAGFAFGLILQRSRFCFASAFRDVFLLRDRRVLLGVLAALAVGSIGYAVVLQAQLPDPSRYLPPTGHIAPAGWHLLLGGLSFGVGMVLAGGCISGNLYRLGEGGGTAPTALLGVGAGYFIAFNCWNWLYVNAVSTAPVVWLPMKLGYAASLALQLGALAAAAALLLKFLPALPPRAGPPVTLPVALRKVFVEGWPSWLGGAAIGVLATFTFLRTEPLGVTKELGRVARVAGVSMGVVPDRLHGLDTMRGCAEANLGSGMTHNGIFVLALVAGSMLGALLAGEFRIRLGRPKAHGLAFGGGILLGFGAMISIGCTVGTLLSGVMVFSLSGWVFAAGLAAGAWAGGKALRRLA